MEMPSQGGWSRGRTLGLGLLSSLLLSAAMPGLLGWWPLLFVALVPLLLLCLHRPPRTSGLVGFGAGLLYHLGLLYWIVIVLGRYGGLPLWLSLAALFLLAVYMSCFSGLFCWLLSSLAGRYWHRERSIAALVWTAPLLWVALDYLRSFLLSGFPWMDLGYGLYSQPRLIQAADLGGHHAVSFALVLGNGLILAIMDRQRSDVRWNLRLERRLLLLACGFLVFIGGYSMLRYDIVSQALASGLSSLQARVAVVQGNVDQARKWSAQAKEQTLHAYVRLSETALARRDTELVVWPETALPFYLQSDGLGRVVRQFVRANNIWLLTGTPSYTIRGATAATPRQVDYYNAAALLAASGRVVGQYRKQHLVPFGEYVPLKQYLAFLEPLVAGAGDFSAGRSAAPLEMGRLRLGVLICFESIFPEIARQSVVQGANLLVNLTNDAWYGRSSAPEQTLAMSVFRAVESKRSLVRAANTGTSALIDPLGNISQASALFEEAVLSGSVAVWERPTVFTDSGHLFGAGCLAATAAVLLFRRREF
ncbi:apolipoprotein N-acyltransferase [Desulfogranum mediterraneum]|uniref:apolipoprotein N-acyltransferase n=1 Tax=Desulfogranum mediterraneum TaxID=160661 RepID=UPI00040C503A|nr:apolipoprotein N-acyltransferase [Desulfogranum mediterraneum]